MTPANPYLVEYWSELSAGKEVSYVSLWTKSLLLMCGNVTLVKAFWGSTQRPLLCDDDDDDDKLLVQN